MQQQEATAESDDLSVSDEAMPEQLDSALMAKDAAANQACSSQGDQLQACRQP